MSNAQDEADLGPVEVSSRNEDGSALLEEETLPEDSRQALIEDASDDLLGNWQENGEKEQNEGENDEETLEIKSRSAEPETLNGDGNEGTTQRQEDEKPSSADGSVSMSDDGPSIQVRHELATRKSSY